MINLIYNFFCAIGISLFLDSLQERRFGKWSTIFNFILINLVFTGSMMFFLSKPEFRIIGVYGSIILINSLLYSSGIIWGIGLVAIFTILSIMIEIPIDFFVAYNYSQNLIAFAQENPYIYFILLFLFYFFLTLIAYFIHDKGKFLMRLDSYLYLEVILESLILFVFPSIILSGKLYNSNTKIFYFLEIIGCVVSVVILKKYTDKKRHEEKIEEIERFFESILKEYTEESMKNETIRFMRHDLKNQIETLKFMYKEGEDK